MLLSIQWGECPSLLHRAQAGTASALFPSAGTVCTVLFKSTLKCLLKESV